ncbi:MAG: DegT/DnrJ/EryC1/StrS family aminotransferase [Alphaproteobacteria bacterium]
MILCANPAAQYRAHRQGIDAAIRRVCDGERYVLGPEVEAFEREFAQYIGVARGIGVANGTDALALALTASGIGAGDEVITVSHTAVATVAAIEIAGASPILVDVEPDHYTIDSDAIERAVTPRTKAVVPVHLYGQPANMDAVIAVARRHGLRLIEDCAQAHGARFGGRRVGGLGDAGCFSFYPTKNLGALGDGGMVVTGDGALADRLRGLRQYGWETSTVSQRPGGNSRLDELQAAVLRVKLPRLDADNARRLALARRYDAALADTGLTLPARREGGVHVHHLYVVRTPRRDELRAYLAERGIQAGVHYWPPAHRQPAYAGRLPGAELLIETDRIAGEVLSLPLYPEIGEDTVDQVAEAVRGFHA